VRGDESLQTFDWYNSGGFWYCSLQRRDGTRVSGAGKTKPQAVADARNELKKVDAKRALKRQQQLIDYPAQRALGDFVAQIVLQRLYAQEVEE